MPKADPAAQRLLLELADVDKAADAARGRRASLPELAVLAAGATRGEELEADLVAARTEVADLDRSGGKLDAEIDAVRQRAQRDAERLRSAGVGTKELDGLQREIESLARRQTTLEDDALVIMERREAADALRVRLEADLATLSGELDAARRARDEQFGVIDEQLTGLAARRATASAGVPADVLAVYDRLRTAGKVGAGPLAGDRCGACRMSLDRSFLELVRSAPTDAVERCPECGALVVRTA